jgi:hypothetical protein
LVCDRDEGAQRRDCDRGAEHHSHAAFAIAGPEPGVLRPQLALSTRKLAALGTVIAGNSQSQPPPEAAGTTKLSNKESDDRSPRRWMPGAPSSSGFEGADVGLIADRCSAALSGTSVWSQLVDPGGQSVGKSL